MENTQTVEIIQLLWHSLKREPGHPDRRKTGWGSKTKHGLAASVIRAAGVTENAYRVTVQDFGGTWHKIPRELFRADFTGTEAAAAEHFAALPGVQKHKDSPGILIHYRAAPVTLWNNTE